MLVSSIEEYLQLAEYCRRSAQEANDHGVKARWLKRAEAWEALAKSSDQVRFIRAVPWLVQCTEALPSADDFTRRDNSRGDL